MMDDNFTIAFKGTIFPNILHLRQISQETEALLQSIMTMKDLISLSSKSE